MEKYKIMFGKNIIPLITLKIQCFFSFVHRLSGSSNTAHLNLYGVALYISVDFL